MTNGFLRVAAAVPKVRVADTTANTQEIENLMVAADGKKIDILCFPELSITAYTCQDLFSQQLLLEEAEHALMKILELSRNLQVTTLVGLPFYHRGMLLNCAAVVHNGKLHGLVPKTYIPNYKEFYERRWFTSATDLHENELIRFCGQSVPLGSKQLFKHQDTTFGIEICEDLWAPIPPSNRAVLEGAELIFNLSASNELVGKNDYVRNLVVGQSARCHCAYIYASSGYGESTQDVVFGGKAFIAENGHLLTEAQPFATESQLVVTEIDLDILRSERQTNTSFAQCAGRFAKDSPYDVRELEQGQIKREHIKLTRPISALPFVPAPQNFEVRCREILSIQTFGLARRIEHTHCKHVVIGVSGGLDSTLALLICASAFDLLGIERRGIIGVTMPGFGTTGRTYDNAIQLMKALGVTMREVNIEKSVMQHFADIDHDVEVRDVTYENAQARERTQILMDIANQTNGFVVGTGDLSELALGWATYNGDHMSMYAVNVSIPKTLIRPLVRHLAEQIKEQDPVCTATLLDIIDTPISPELLPADEQGNIAQITEDLVGPYELHDFFLYYTLRFGFRPTKIFLLASQAFDGRQGITYSPETIAQWLRTFFRRFFTQQFKRSCLPDGPKVGSCSLSPRGDWRMPSDACADEWLRECDSLLDKNE